jgi:acetyltransferase-like isoleucine patch superfamily enzyme
MRQFLIWLLNGLSLILTSGAAATCWLGERNGRSDLVYSFWTHVFASIPGYPGMLLRRAFYRWTLQRCASDVTIEFGALMTQRRASLGPGVYVGPYALVGWAEVGAHTLIGSRASLLSGGNQHQWSAHGWTPTRPTSLAQIVIGSRTWIGEGAILMSSVGSGCMVAAGAVVSAAVPDGVMVAGNPARFVRRVAAEAPEHRAHEPQAAVLP